MYYAVSVKCEMLRRIFMIFEKVANILASQLGVDEESITRETDIVSDLSADSLDMVELLMCIEDEFGVVVDDEDVQDLRLVGDVVSYIEAHM